MSANVCSLTPPGKLNYELHSSLTNSLDIGINAPPTGILFQLYEWLTGMVTLQVIWSGIVRDRVYSVPIWVVAVRHLISSSLIYKNPSHYPCYFLFYLLGIPRWYQGCRMAPRWQHIHLRSPVCSSASDSNFYSALPLSTIHTCSFSS